MPRLLPGAVLVTFDTATARDLVEANCATERAVLHAEIASEIAPKPSHTPSPVTFYERGTDDR